MISTKAQQGLLGIPQDEDVPLLPHEMIGNVEITLLPASHRLRPASKNVLNFTEKLMNELQDIGVKCVAFEDSLCPTQWSKFEIKLAIKIFLFMVYNFILQLFGFQKKNALGLNIMKCFRFGKKERKGVSVISAGEFQEGKMSVDYFPNAGRDNGAIAIVDIPDGITAESEFKEHYEACLRLISYHMVKLVIAVDDKQWILYNLNGSHPIYSFDELRDRIMDGFIPKLAAPLLPPKMSDFGIATTHFDPYDELHHPVATDLEESGTLFEKRGLFPKGKQIKDLPFRNELHKHVVHRFLDERTGMSYGFLARQLPVELSEVMTLKEAARFPEYNAASDLFCRNGHTHVVIRDCPRLGDIVVRVPDVWVLTARSGADKTKLDRKHDLIKLGLINGRMMMEFPHGTTKLPAGCRPSFDSRCILSIALANAIVASIAKAVDVNDRFANHTAQHGLAISHWHGYFNPEKLPFGWHLHGENNPDVACSTAQSAIFALRGKLEVFFQCLERETPFYGDAHVEPNHGVNVTYWSLKELGCFVNTADDIVAMGNKYLRPKTAQYPLADTKRAGFIAKTLHNSSSSLSSAADTVDTDTSF